MEERRRQESIILEDRRKETTVIVDRACCALTMSCYRARNHGETSGEVSILNHTLSPRRNFWFNCAPLRRQFIYLHKIWRNVRNIFVGASTALGKARIFATRSAVLAVGVRRRSDATRILRYYPWHIACGGDRETLWSWTDLG